MKQTYTDRDYFEEKFKGIEDQLSHVTKVLEGNGKPGLITKVQNLEVDVENKQRLVYGWVKGVMWVSGGVITIISFLMLRYGLPFVEGLSAHIYGR